MSADASALPVPSYAGDVFFWRWRALRMIRRRRSKWVVRRLRLPAEQWPWPDQLESPKAVNFENRRWLFDHLEAAERAVDYVALCRAGREAHARILEAAGWLKDHDSLRERLRGRPWSAVDALDIQGSELFHACRPSYTLEAQLFQDGTLGARISRVLERPPAARTMIRQFDAEGYEIWRQVRLAGWVLLGDGLESAIAAERTEIVRTDVQQLDDSTSERYEQAMSELDYTLLENALAWDEAVLRRQENEPFVEQLNRSLRKSP